ncbi:M28 family metallopeptidase [Rhinopithecimicrobium faecis]|uniref:M28 family metallopeptidase n=1 Tax=Rhinopithecimicrobium faecis TaxID=2820698 RepID=UPI003365579C
MKTNIFFLLSFLLIFNNLFAQEGYGRKVVEELASKPYFGRGYLHNGDRKAAEFIRKEFKEFKLQPLGDSYFQSYSFSANTFPVEPTVRVNGKKLQLAINYLVDAASPAIAGKFAIQPITITSSTPEYIESLVTNTAWKGKVLFIDEDETLKLLKAPEWKVVLDQLKDRGLFEGIILNSKQKLKWRALTYQQKKACIITQNLKLDPTSTNQLAINIAPKLNPKHITQNVCGYIPGTSNTDSTLVITAHYDHIGGIGKKVYFPGANDNASGTALLLYLAKYYAENPPKYNMVFLAFSGEEIGLQGSKYYANNPLLPLAKIKFLVNLDMAGTGDDGIQVVNGTEFRKEFDRMVALNAQHKFLPDVKIRSTMNRSDHAPFFEKGVPSFFIYTLGGIDAYHDIFDRYETLPFTNFTNYAELLKHFIATF